MRCAECGLYECCMRTPLGGCPNGEKANQVGIQTSDNTASAVNHIAGLKGKLPLGTKTIWHDGLMGESEDERLEKVRENLIKALKREIDAHCEGYAYFGITLKDIVALLEKQKDYRKLYEDITKSEWFKKTYVGKSLGEEDEKEEQKLVIKDYRLRDTWEYLDEFIEKFGRLPKDCDEISACIDYVLRRRPEQNPAEWSEEDKEMRRRCGQALFDHGYLKEYDWFKTYRPQPHWKPSEEQMEALKSAVKLYKDTHFEIHHEKIVSLYEQLKKL